MVILAENMIFAVLTPLTCLLLLVLKKAYQGQLFCSVSWILVLLFGYIFECLQEIVSSSTKR